MKYKKYRKIFIILIIILIFLLVGIIYKYKKRIDNEKEKQQIIELFSENNSNNNEYKQLESENNSSESNDTEQNTKIEMCGYEVIGTIKIAKIGIEYPILAIETSTPETTKKPMKVSVVRYWGGDVNSIGNLSIAGHNNYDGTMFGKTKKLEIGDVIELKDLKRQTVIYKIYKKFVTNPDDVSVLLSDNDNIREVTLITCTQGNKARLILKAREL